MNPDVFRQTAHRLVDWMADYLEGVEHLPVRAQVRPGETLDRLPGKPPATGQPVEAILDDFESIILPGMTHWQHPRFFAYFPANSSRPSVLGEMLTATLAAQCMSWETSPAATELEIRMMEWLRHLIGLPTEFVGSIQDTASTATLCAMLTARERATGFTVGEAGLVSRAGLTAYCSTEAHSSIDKAVKLAGLGRDNLRKIPVDAAHAMIPEALDRTITADRDAGRTPVCVVACLGTTGTSGIDPLGPIAAICRRHATWLHVDAAWAGSALVLPEYRWMIDGIDGVDSFVFNPHKWLFTNFDCSAYFVRDPGMLVRTFATAPEYLRTRVDEVTVNYRNWGIQLGRRFRALKLWFVLRSFGVAGLQERIRGHIALARELGERIRAEPDFELSVPPALSLLCFRFTPPGITEPEPLDGLNEQLLHRLNDTGQVYLTHTRVRGALAIRFVVGQTGTEARHVNEAWELIRETARQGLGGKE